MVSPICYIINAFTENISYFNVTPFSAIIFGSSESTVRLSILISALRILNPREGGSGRPLYISLSMPKGEPRRSREEWEVYAKAFLSKMGFPAGVPYCVYRHGDTECDHVHIVASRVSLDGSVFLGQKDVEKAIEATQEIEKEYGLTRTEGLGKTRRRLELSEMKMMERTQKLSDKQIIKIYVEKSLAKSSTMEDFRLNLTDYGITIKLNTAKNGRVSGISFQRGDFAIKGSNLGSKYSYASLSRKLPSVMEISIGNEQTLSKQREHTRTR